MVSKDVCSAIVKLLLPRYISFPSGAALREIVDGFEDVYGFHQCAGAVDGSHILSSHCRSVQLTKGWQSIVLQGTVGHFMDGWPGRVHDACVFSSLYQRGQNVSLLPNWKSWLLERICPLCLAIMRIPFYLG